MFDWRCPSAGAFAYKPLDGPLGYAMLVDALRLPKERRTGDVMPQRGRRERKRASIGHLLPPRLREKLANQAAAANPGRLLVADKRSTNIVRRDRRRRIK